MRDQPRWLGLLRHALIAVAIFVAGDTAQAAKLESPLTMLRRPEHQVAVVRAIGSDSNGIRCEVVEAIRGEAEGELVLKTALVGEVAVRAGQRYLVGFSDLLWMAQQRSFAKDSEGYRLLAVNGVGAAIFEDHRQLEKLLASREATDPLRPKRVVGLLLDLLESEERASRHLAATELQMQPAHWEGFNRRRARRLQRALEGADSDPYMRFALLQVADGLAEIGVVDGARVAAESREALADSPLAPDFTTHQPALAILALQILAERGTADDADLAARQLDSTHPTVGTAAVRTLFALAPSERAAELGRVALASGTLNAETRQVLEAYLRRES